jgi:glutathione peroxidase
MSIFTSLYTNLFEPRHVIGEIYDFKMLDIQGEEIDFAQYKGRKLLIVNTASKCGFTPQYADLEKLHRTYGDKVTVLGFPSNNFLWQEPGSDEEILSFCKSNYEVTFKLFSKISVRGSFSHPLYKWLNSKTDKVPTWNFCKYLISEDGKQVTFFSSGVASNVPRVCGFAHSDCQSGFGRRTGRC